MLLPVVASEAATWAGSSVAALLEAVRHSGVDILYSSAQVPEGLRIGTEPQGTTLLTQTADALRPFGLMLQSIAPGHYIVSRSPAPAPDSVQSHTQVADLSRADAIEDITVFASRYAFADVGTGGSQELSRKQIEQIPGAATDVVKAARMLPGIAAADDVRPYIRGSAQDDVMVVYDNVKISDPFHLRNFQSLLSAFDASVIGGMEVYSGGFPVRFGTRSGGVINLTPRSASAGNEYAVSAGPTTQRVSLLGQTGDQSLEWLGALRRSIPKSSVEQDGSGFDRAIVGDAVARLRWTPTPSSSWILGAMLLSDRIDLHGGASLDEADARYRDSYSWLSFVHQPETGWHSTMTLAVMQLNRRREGTIAQPYVVTGALAEDRNFKGFTAANEWVLQQSELLRFDVGAELGQLSGENDYHRTVTYSPATASSFGLDGTAPVLSTADPREQYYGAYGSVHFQQSARFESEVGLRLDGQRYFAGVAGREWTPRLNFRYRATPKVDVFASWGRFSQAQRPNEWRLEADQQLPDPVQTVTHTTVGLTGSSAVGVAWRFELYRKHWSHVAPYYDNVLSTQSLLPDLIPDRVLITPTAANSKGLELSARGALGPDFQWWGSFSRSQVRDEIGSLSVPRSWDQSKAVNAGLGWHHGPYAVSGTARYHSGWPRTPVLLVSRSTPQDPWISLGERNAARWPDFISADMRASWNTHFAASELEMFAEIFNVSDRRNVSYLGVRAAGPNDEASSYLGYWSARQFNLGVTITWH